MTAVTKLALGLLAYATAYLFTETSFPIAIVPLDVCDKLPIPGQFMDTLRAANSSECNQGIYEALLVSYDTFAAEQPFKPEWKSNFRRPTPSTRRASVAASARWRGGSRRNVVPVTASARWRGGSRRSTQYLSLIHI